MLLKIVVLCVLTQLIKADNPVTFRLYTRNNAATYIPLVTGQLQNSPIDVTKPIKFITHGYTDSADRDWVQDMKNAYLANGDYNVVQVDWESLAAQLYDDSAEDTRIVGQVLSDLIVDLYHTRGLPLKNVHLIGHSLGAHVSGFAGQNVITAVGQTIARITGMDAASPLFYGNPPNERLSVGDADFVDCIHTDGFKYGYGTSLGDIDFYPNGGIALQPGCLTFSLGKADAGPIIACSHCRAYAYFTESINSNAFLSKECSSYFSYLLGQCRNNPTAIMGENVDESTRGNYFLTTNAWSPYGKGSRNLANLFNIDNAFF